MRIAYFGTAAFAVPALEAVAEHVVAVVSQPDRPTGRGLHVQPSPVKSAAESLGLPVLTPERSRAPEFVAQVREWGVDFLLVAAYGQILSAALLESARQGAINLHGSILPEWRGAAPIQRSILAGQRETGVTLMQMDRGMDTGDIIEVRRLAIGRDETAGDLTPRLAHLAAEMAREWAPRIARGGYTRIPQDAGLATLAPKVEKSEAELSYLRPAEEEYNRFRAFTPAPGAFLRTRLGALKLVALGLGTAVAEVPGTVIEVKPTLELAFAGGSLCLRQVQPAGKSRMSGAEWANGVRLRPGDLLSG